MTHVTRRIFDEIARSGCSVCTYDLVTDILLSISMPYYYHNHSPFQSSNIRSFSVTCKPQEYEYLSIRVECDDNKIYEVVYDRERLKTYKEEIK